MSIDRRFALIIVVGIVLSALSEVFFVDHRKYLFAGSTLLLFWVGFGFGGLRWHRRHLEVGRPHLPDEAQRPVYRRAHGS